MESQFGCKELLQNISTWTTFFSKTFQLPDANKQKKQQHIDANLAFAFYGAEEMFECLRF